MSGSVYVVDEIVGTSTESWEDAINHAIETAARTLEDLRVGEVVKQDVTLENGKVAMYRVRVNISFKYHPDAIGPHYVERVYGGKGKAEK
ncbi:MAG: dodecin family protein [Syntrophorhabdaceae bacterium]|nr:dodecin family protein [Syntrophorhabdaceae bacterium]MDD4196730.1 dodecin family protein [Syntrophorhabdaceae bacterium]HOC45869.1 dodecin family protein [Syntrophorhabdaceae bacterium]